MKKNARILSFLFLLFSSALSAQIGIKAGLNLTSFYTNQEIIEDKRATVGLQGGLVFGVPLEERFSLQPELLYTRRGASLALDDRDLEAHLDYLDIPLIFVWKPHAIDFLHFHIGPQFSYLTNVEYEITLLDGTKEVNADLENFNRWDLGLIAGLRMHSEPFFLDLRYFIGFRSIDKTQEVLGVEVEGENLKNYGLQVAVGMLFGSSD
jgi:hypothetical protein